MLVTVFMLHRAAHSDRFGQQIGNHAYVHIRLLGAQRLQHHQAALFPVSQNVLQERFLEPIARTQRLPGRIPALAWLEWSSTRFTLFWRCIFSHDDRLAAVMRKRLKSRAA